MIQKKSFYYTTILFLYDYWYDYKNYIHKAKIKKRLSAWNFLMKILYGEEVLCKKLKLKNWISLENSSEKLWATEEKFLSFRKRTIFPFNHVTQFSFLSIRIFQCLLNLKKKNSRYIFVRKINMGIFHFLLFKIVEILKFSAYVTNL